ncbi:hypothetical protein [Hathewaya massiliensis]|uniref:hypothetical protein n=1 Tax=Hathewaya massiliensis TaxID=1964382 RepID=UPI00115B7780|nr:hypothetical protein [Hathewaya massiliensis]
MIFFMIMFYVLIALYDLKNLYNKNLKKEIPVYIFIISISLIISSLEVLKIKVPDPMIPFGKFMELIKIF